MVVINGVWCIQVRVSSSCFHLFDTHIILFSLPFLFLQNKVNDGWSNIVASQSGQYVAMLNPKYPTDFRSVYVSSDYGVTFDVTLQVPSINNVVYYQTLAIDASGKW